MIPPVELGWFNRTKTQHFILYNQLATELAHSLDIEPWLLLPLFETCGQVSFSDSNTVDMQTELIPLASKLLNNIQKKYTQYHILQKPFIAIKSDTGTYGMAVMRVHSAEELLSLNRKQRLKMSMEKNNQPVSRVILQEGIPTIEYNETFAFEPVIYSIGKTVVGGFYKIHGKKSPFNNLNAPGMYFEPIQTLSYAYQVMARLAQLAASLESINRSHHV